MDSTGTRFAFYSFPEVATTDTTKKMAQEPLAVPLVALTQKNSADMILVLYQKLLLVLVLVVSSISAFHYIAYCSSVHQYNSIAQLITVINDVLFIHLNAKYIRLHSIMTNILSVC